MKRVFADTSYFIALVVQDDVAHERAAQLATEPWHLVTTAWVMTELAAYLSDPANRPVFISLLSSLRGDPNTEFVPASHELFERGVELYAARPDKAWSLVDCISFIVMQRERLTDSLTTDQHFAQAGFRALLAHGA